MFGAFYFGQLVFAAPTVADTPVPPPPPTPPAIPNTIAAVFVEEYHGQKKPKKKKKKLPILEEIIREVTVLNSAGLPSSLSAPKVVPWSASQDEEDLRDIMELLQTLEK